ncbi:MAG: hypothetical protein WCI05_09250 [Myxococcales bacterium]|jgi:hypothetical protein
MRRVVAFSVLVGCSGTTPEPSAVDGIVVAASDYSSSAVGAVALDGGSSLFVGFDLGKDPALAASRGRAFFLARDEDTLFELDTSTGKPKSRRSFFDPSLGFVSNPQDIAVAPSGDLWIPLYNVPTLLVLGSGERRIDLSRFDSDGNPQASAVRMLDINGVTKAFVTLERLDDLDMLRSKQSSLVVRLDVATEKVDGELELEGRNPFGGLREFGGVFFLATPGNFDVSEESHAGIERMDPVALTSRVIASEQALGGSVAEVAVTDHCGAAIVADATPNVNATSLVTFDPDTGEVFVPASRSQLSTSGYDLRALEWRDGVLLVGNWRESRVHVFDRVGTCGLRLREASIPLAQRPIALRSFR